MVAAAAREDEGKTLGFLLLDYPDLQLTEAAVLAAANNDGNWFDDFQAISLVLNRKPHVELTQAFVAVAEKNEWWSEHILDLVKKTRGAIPTLRDFTTPRCRDNRITEDDGCECT